MGAKQEDSTAVYDSLTGLIPEFDPKALINYPGRHAGIVRTSTSQVRRQMKKELDRGFESDASPPTTHNREQLLLHLRSTWNGLYLCAMEQPKKVDIYRDLLGIDPDGVRGEKRIVTIQVIGAIEERLGRVGLTSEDLTNPPANSLDPAVAPEDQDRHQAAVEAVQNALQIATVARAVLGRSTEQALSL